MLLGVVLSFANSCTKHDSIRVNESPIKLTNSSTEYYENDLNPWDYRGGLHNQGMDFVINSLNSYTPYTDTNDFLNDIITNFGIINFSLTSTQVSNALSILETELNDAMVNNDDNFKLAVEDLIDQNDSLSSNVKNYLHNINSFVLGSSQSVLTIVNQIKNVESVVLSDANLSSKETEIILTYTSIYRHSLHYWDTYVDSHWPDYVPHGIWERIKNWFKNNFETVATADVIGLLPILVYDDNTGLWIMGSITASIFVAEL